MKYSLTQGSILFMVIGPIVLKYLGDAGVSEACANETVQLLPVWIGAIGAWIGRYRAGGISLLGVKK